MKYHSHPTHLAARRLPLCIAITAALLVGFSSQASAADFIVDNRTLDVDGVLLTTSRLYVGRSGDGILNIKNGGVVNPSDLIIASRATGTVNVTGIGSQLNASSVSVGSQSTGYLNIENGGVVTGSGTIGFYDEGIGFARVTGAGSEWNVTGTFYIGTLGNGTLDILDSGKVTVKNIFTVGYLGKGTVNLDGGTLQIASGSLGTGGIFNWVKGTLGYTGDATIGTGFLASTTALGAGKVLSVAKNLTIGTGNTLQANGGTVSAGTLTLDGGTLQTTDTSTIGGVFNWIKGTLGYTGDANVGTGLLTNTTLGVGQTLSVGNNLTGDTLNLDGGTLQFASATATGALNWIKGTLGYTGDANLGSGVLASTTTLVAGQTLSVAKALAVNSVATLNLNGGQANVGALNLEGQATLGTFSSLSVGSGGMDNTGYLQLAGGTLDGAGALVNNGYVTGYGVIAGSGGFTNNALLTQADGTLTLRNTGANTNAGNWDMAPGRQLKLDGSTLANTGVLNLNGGSVTGSGTVSNSVGGTVAGRGTISSSFMNAGRVVVDSGITTITKAFTNAGQILLGSNSATLAGGNVSNSGLIQGLGQVNNNINNTGTVQATGGLLTLNGKLTNTGVVTIDSGATLSVTSGLSSNAGKIQLAGGVLDNGGFAMTNEAAGTISGAGSLRSGVLTNDGQVQLSGDASNIYAAVVSNSGSKIILSGASNTTFYGWVDVNAGAELKVSQGAVATFFGQVQQRTGSNFTGTGTKLYEGGLSVGASPGLGTDAGNVTFGDANIYLAEIGGTTACTLICGTNDAVKNSSYDKYIVDGKLSFGGTLRLASWNGYVAQAGQSFDLLDWGSTAGNFASIDASGLTLAAGTQLDYSQLYTTGTISVTAVPEPDTYAMLLAGLALMGTVVRRRRAAVPLL